MHGPRPEHVDNDPYQDDPRIVNTYNGMSPSGDAEADVVYANYGAPDDFDKLKAVECRLYAEKIVIVRYGQKFSRRESVCRAGAWRRRGDYLFGPER